MNSQTETSMLDVLSMKCHEMALSKGWYERGRELPELLMLVVSELSEALEEARKPATKFRNEEVSRAIEYEGDKPIGVAVEIADALIRIFDLCGYFELPIGEAVRVKMEYNANRPHRHGGKRY